VSGNGLTLRAFIAADLPALIAYRNDPEVARYQDWPLPYTGEMADRNLTPMGPIENGWERNLAIEHDGRFVGDVYVHVDGDGTTGSIGYTLDPSATGQGIATRAAALVVDTLFAAGVHRIASWCDPENRASMRVLERLGFRHEGRTISSTFAHGQWLDDDRFALLDSDRVAWLHRPSTSPRSIELCEIDGNDDSLVTISRLTTHRSQEWFVSPMRSTFRDMAYPEVIALDYPSSNEPALPVVPWSRSIVADGEVVGFVLVAAARPLGPHHEPYLWRFLVDRMHQRRGIGWRAMHLVVDAWRDLGHTTMLTSWVPDLPGTPEPFYLRFGFVPTGDIDDGEVVARYTAHA
jgi:RimJ/RimL family protein N-acetyltransferase